MKNGGIFNLLINKTIIEPQTEVNMNLAEVKDLIIFAKSQSIKKISFTIDQVMVDVDFMENPVVVSTDSILNETMKIEKSDDEDSIFWSAD
jgi:hypothetical protein